MRKIISLIIIAVVLNLTILSITHGQSNVSIGGIVPVTDLNRNSPRQQINVKNQNPATGENKYLYFFEKTLGLETEAGKNPDAATAEGQTVHDRIFSSLLLWLLMIIVAVLVIIILKMFDRVFFKLPKSRRKL